MLSLSQSPSLRQCLSSLIQDLPTGRHRQKNIQVEIQRWIEEGKSHAHPDRQGQDRGLTLPAGSRLMSSLGQLFETVQTHIPSHTIYELVDARIHG